MTSRIAEGTLVRVTMAAPFHQGVVGIVEFYGTGESAGTVVLNTTVSISGKDKIKARGLEAKTLIAVDPRQIIPVLD